MARGTPTYDWVLIERMECRTATDKALLVLNDNNDELWVPRSVLHEHSEVNNKFTKGDLIVAGWYAKKENLGGGPYEPLE